MKINLNKPVLQIDGKRFQQMSPDGALSDMPETLGEHLYGVVAMSIRGDEGLDLDKKLKLYRLAQRVFAEKGDASFTAEEISTFKERANRMYPGAHLVGALCDLLEEAT